MYPLNDHLARAQVTSRLDEAQRQRRGHELARVHRRSRRAERAVQQARTALARAL
ncbi:MULTISPECIES: hypothetical protein [Nocardioides]|uniref:Uncharacterized protein n=1 Tax=Nocardioides kribbensis TaxID=305517 RepID=A0ABV1NTP8_9ACTN|nr:MULTISPECIES: hypothetical protein [Nocardioides]MCM3515784.1 hypothetical protein [Nocardioides sp. P86]